MSIHVVCSNGHALKIKEKYAGVMGLCPICRIPIRVPDPTDVFGEDSIMDVLQPHESGLSGISLQVSDVDSYESGTPKEPTKDTDGTKKKCAKCRKQVPNNAHVCPYCHAYVPPLQWR